ncbi:Myb-like DNA-binding domain-containing protein [Giardia muris]|uniref:Myb-like DNA-binding domain-containing protein n=1 Tax=Giardia muris TaxID=5742 RepID=A0A4Z1T6V2_GIAMU|nr:Myb-like DNA-binding domain-containing protein [Giardia muris]|eukprot:TNJ29793.1 Myb-like DNA-binding domain-containing protein [Giardia muris]
MSLETPSSLNTWTSEYLVSYQVNNNGLGRTIKGSADEEAQNPDLVIFSIPSPSSTPPPKLSIDSSSVKWTRDEELKLIGFYLAFGVDWDRASQYIPGRTPSVIKCKFNNLRRHSAVVARKRQDDIGLFMQRFSVEVEKASMTLGSFHTEYVLTGKFPIIEEAIKHAREKAIERCSIKEKPKETGQRRRIRVRVLKRQNTLVRLTRIEHRIRMTRETPTSPSLDSLQKVCRAMYGENNPIFQDAWLAYNSEPTPKRAETIAILNSFAC